MSKINDKKILLDFLRWKTLDGENYLTPQFQEISLLNRTKLTRYFHIDDINFEYDINWLIYVIKKILSYGGRYDAGSDPPYYFNLFNEKLYEIETSIRVIGWEYDNKNNFDIKELNFLSDLNNINFI